MRSGKGVHSFQAGLQLFSIGRGMVRYLILRPANQQINWQSQISPHHQLCWGASSSLMYCSSVGHQQQGNMGVPISLVVIHKFRELVLDGAVKPLHHSIGLGVQWCGSGFVYPQQSALFREYKRLKVPPLVRVNDQWHSEPAHKIIHQRFSNSNGFLVGHRIGFHPIGEIISSGKEIFVACLSGWKWAQDINCQHLHGSTNIMLTQGCPAFCCGASSGRTQITVLAECADIFAALNPIESFSDSCKGLIDSQMPSCR